MSDARNVKYLPGGGADITDIEVVEPGPGEIQVSKAACGICSWDLQTFRWGSDHRSAAPPGHEGVGHVTKVGEGVQGYEVGDRVVGGGFASVGNMRARSAYKIPPSNMADEHWVVEPVSCCVTGVDRCELKVGERMIMIGTGFMGLISLQILRGMGADQLICLDVDDKRLEMARELGATETYNTTAEGFDEVKQKVMKANKKKAEKSQTGKPSETLKLAHNRRILRNQAPTIGPTGTEEQGQVKILCLHISAHCNFR